MEEKASALVETFYTTFTDQVEVMSRMCRAKHILFGGRLADDELIRHLITEELSSRNIQRAIKLNIEVKRTLTRSL